jgi:hypothetical protein
MIAILAGAPALGIVGLIVTAILIGTREGQPTLRRTRLAGWWVLWSLVAAILTLAGGVRRAGGWGLRKLAARIRAALRPHPKAAPRGGKHRAVTAR